MAVESTTPVAVTERLSDAERVRSDERSRAATEGRGPEVGVENVQLVRAIVAALDLARTGQVGITEVRATGNTNIAQSVSIATAQWKPVYLRIHFTGNVGVASVLLDLDHATGAQYDCRLFESRERGRKADGSADLFMRFEAEETSGPSPWSFAPGDFLKISWTNPDSGNITWGMAVGLALA